MSLQQLLGDEIPAEKVCAALLDYEKKKSEEDNADSKLKKSNLLEDEEDTTSTVWLQLATLKFITNNRKLIPFKIPLKHAIIPSSYEACLIVKDPQRTYKDLVSEAGMSGVVTRVIGLSKLKAKWKSFEQKRQLRDQFDLFLADDRIISMLPNVLGKTFYSKTKAPIPVRISSNNADQLKKQVVSAYNATYFRASPCSSFMIRCGHTANTPQELADNIESILKYLCEKKVVPNGGKGISSVHVKTTQSMAVPLWNNPNLEEEVKKLRASTKDKESPKRKSIVETKTATTSPNKKARTDSTKNLEMKQKDESTKKVEGEGKGVPPQKKASADNSPQKAPQKQKAEKQAITKQNEEPPKKKESANQQQKKNGSSVSPSKQPEQGPAQTKTTNGKKKAGKQKAKGKQ
ncbi:U3 snoRNP-associated protein Cic1/Utp30 family protein [Schizosaccharomyces cryophilus OY26]|uniref:U3 snoRNP-associated protein Cic1/Utp30 family protein n=1 Tax=Schizosaccharomyces cryophilus (strain OY26 / ATCC MYA-4695 / CBS 11777 / NBRC 106824 / NRRL Y48691) TaxID=653667 RepID=S9W5K1_SCHCR|nr:U3 snoRNP-associated protein Cic1/Utp30 family protein [Schizosaccharomyces cryophilus OY26]EPY53260.1 U3 snoRNP-associated protein Cic1/Utp30 family protein [Schizosaccharomyces cryophilus OY26]